MTVKHFISRNYKHPYCGGVIAKTDIEITLEKLGFSNIGLKRTFSKNNIVNAVRCFLSVMVGICRIKENDIILLQYPLSNYYRLVCKIARWRKAKIITLIHDLRAFRNKSITANEENIHLSDSAVLLTHNDVMQEWLKFHGCKIPMINYEIMDYIHGESARIKTPHDQNYSIYYVGNLSNETNGFLYQLAEIMPDTTFYLYGFNPDLGKVNQLPNIKLMGFMPDTEIIAKHNGDLGLSWYGNSIDGGVGNVGEYMRYNNPHKVSLYIRCNTPVIVWAKAGRAKFIEDEKIGICVNSLRDVRQRFESISIDKYHDMSLRVQRINQKLKAGYYLKEAIEKASEIIDYNFKH